MFDIQEIQKVLPQRFPFLLIDRVIELEPGRKVVATKNVSVNEGFFAGHFPGNPVMPGVLIIEAMAQAAIMLFYSEEAVSSGKKKAYYMSSVKARFMNPVFPGDQLKIMVEPVKLVPNAAIVSCVCQVEDKEIAKAEMGFAIRKL